MDRIGPSPVRYSKLFRSKPHPDKESNSGPREILRLFFIGERQIKLHVADNFQTGKETFYSAKVRMIPYISDFTKASVRHTSSIRQTKTCL